MIEKTGTGAHASEVIITTSQPAGFYSFGVRLEGTSIPAGAGLSLSGSSPSPIPLSAAVSQAAPKTANVQSPFWVEPGSVFAFTVTPFGNYGSNPPAAWSAKFFLLKSEDVATA